MKLPILSGRDVIKILSKQGFTVARQKGSHIILVKEMIDGKKGVGYKDELISKALDYIDKKNEKRIMY